MDDIMGVSLKRFVVTVLAVLAMVFFLIDGAKALELVVLLSIIVAVYLLVVLILGMARRSDMLGAGGSMSVESSFGVLLLLYNISAMENGKGLTMAAYIMNIIVGVLLLVFALF